MFVRKTEMAKGLITVQGAQPSPSSVPLVSDETETKEFPSNHSWKESVTDPIIKAATELGGSHKWLDS